MKKIINKSFDFFTCGMIIMMGIVTFTIISMSMVNGVPNYDKNTSTNYDTTYTVVLTNNSGNIFSKKF